MSSFFFSMCRLLDWVTDRNFCPLFGRDVNSTDLSVALHSVCVSGLGRHLMVGRDLLPGEL